MSSLARGQNGEQVIELVQADDQYSDGEGDGARISPRGEKGEPNFNTTNRKRHLKFTETQGLKTLVDSASLDLKKYDTVNMVDPLFKQTT